MSIPKLSEYLDAFEKAASAAYEAYLELHTPEKLAFDPRAITARTMANTQRQQQIVGSNQAVQRRRHLLADVTRRRAAQGRTLPGAVSVPTRYPLRAPTWQQRQAANTMASTRRQAQVRGTNQDVQRRRALLADVTRRRQARGRTLPGAVSVSGQNRPSVQAYAASGRRVPTTMRLPETRIVARAPSRPVMKLPAQTIQYTPPSKPDISFEPRRIAARAPSRVSTGSSRTTVNGG